MTGDVRELMHRIYAAWNAGDVESVVPSMDEDCEWRPVLGTAGARATVYRGPEGMLAYRQELDEVVGPLTARPKSIRQHGASVVVRVEVTIEGVRSGLRTTHDFFHVWTLREGKLFRGTSFEREEDALEAAGLRDA